MKTAGKWLTWTGLAITAICVVAGVIMAVNGFGKISEVVDRSFRVDAPTTYNAAADEVLVLYGPRDATPHCEVTGPAPTVPGPGQSTTFTFDGRTLSSFASYRFSSAGEYLIACESPGVVAGPPVPVGGIVSGAGGILLAVFGGGLGLVLLVIGVVLWIVGANQERRTPPGAYPHAHADR